LGLDCYALPFTQTPKKNPKEDFAWAVKTGDIAAVKQYLQAVPKDVNLQEESNSKRTPLHWAADFGQVEVINYLVSKGAKVNVTDQYGITPLLAAVYENHPAAVRALLDHKADASVKGADGKTAKEAAETEEMKKVFH